MIYSTIVTRYINNYIIRHIFLRFLKPNSFDSRDIYIYIYIYIYTFIYHQYEYILLACVVHVCELAVSCATAASDLPPLISRRQGAGDRRATRPCRHEDGAAAMAHHRGHHK